MAHFAELDDNNIVLRVTSVNNNVLLNELGEEVETNGSLLCNKLFGGRWVQTSYSASFRKNFAGVNFKYDSTLDAFIPPKPFNDWVLNEVTCKWEPPVSDSSEPEDSIE